MQSRFFVSAIACVVALQMSPGIAAGGPGEGPVEVTFTKWRTAGVPPPPAVATRSLFAGNVGGDLGEGDFVGEVLDRKVSTRRLRRFAASALVDQTGAIWNPLRWLRQVDQLRRAA